jgi:hypothetical protein
MFWLNLRLDLSIPQDEVCDAAARQSAREFAAFKEFIG